MRSIIELARERKEYAVGIRRKIHSNPELSFKEFETAQLVKNELEKMGIFYRGITPTGVVAEIVGDLPGKTVALRADMDAIEVRENNDLAFKSQKEGIMHACGHDAHTAALLTAADILNQCKSMIKGRVLFIFQPAEEMVQGAPLMMAEDPFMDKVDSIFAIHLNPDYPAGKVCCRDGGFMFAGEMFKILVEGKSGHGARPDSAIDALLAGSAIVMNSQAILARELDPREAAVVTICTFQSGTRHNIIAGQAELRGTYRCYNEATKDAIKEAINRMVENTADSFRAKGAVEYSMYVPAVINDAGLGKIVRTSALKVVPDDDIVEMSGLTVSDDFSFYLDKAPGFYLMIGSGSEREEERVPIHSDKFIVDEACLPIAAAMYAQIAVDYLNG